VYLNGLGGRDH